MATKEHKSILVYKHGEMTCASKPGEFCRFLGAKSFGQQPWCLLFDEKLFAGPENRGWVERCAKCLQVESEEVYRERVRDEDAEQFTDHLCSSLGVPRESLVPALAAAKKGG